MPNFDHTGPTGKGSRSGRGMGQCMNRGGANMRKAPETDAANTPENWQAAGMGAGMGAGMCASQGRCCRHGQRHNNRARNCGMNGDGAGMGKGMGRGMRQGNGMGRGMAANQTDSCGTGSAPGSDGTDNNS